MYVWLIPFPILFELSFELLFKLLFKSSIFLGLYRDMGLWNLFHRSLLSFQLHLRYEPKIFHMSLDLFFKKLKMYIPQSQLQWIS